MKIKHITLLTFHFLLLSTAVLPLNTLLAQSDCSFKEENGLLIFEAEELPLNTDWALESSVSSFLGDGYIVWNGDDHFGDAGSGIITTKFQISNPGKYTFHWRSKVGEGSSSTDFNDTWIKFPDADDFYAELGSNIYYPTGSGKSPNPEGAGDDGFFKVFLHGTLDWTWASVTSDNEGYTIKAEFDNEGVYTMQLAARSKKHLIDRIVLYKDDVTEATATNNNNVPVECTNLDPSVLSIESSEYEIGAIYPNPVTDLLFFKRAHEIIKVTVLNLNGKEIDIDTTISGGAIDTKQLNSGIYILKVLKSDGIIYSYRLTKQ